MWDWNHQIGTSFHQGKNEKFMEKKTFISRNELSFLMDKVKRLSKEMKCLQTQLNEIWIHRAREFSPPAIPFEQSDPNRISSLGKRTKLRLKRQGFWVG